MELSVNDGNDCATFVVFGREMLKLTKHDAAALALDEVYYLHCNAFVIIIYYRKPSSNSCKNNTYPIV